MNGLKITKVERAKAITDDTISIGEPNEGSSMFLKLPKAKTK